MHRKNVLRVLGLMIVLWAVLFQMPLYGAEGGTENLAASATLQPVPDELVQITGIPKVVVVSGTNYEMGYQYGQQAAALIFQNKVVMRSKLEKIYGKITVADDVKVWTYYIEKYDKNLKGWLNGIVAGCKSKRFNVAYADLILNMVYPEELWARPIKPYPKATRVKERNKKPSTYREKEKYCSAFAATSTATTDGKPLVSISSGMDGGGDVNANVILLAFPTEGNSFISLPHAGRTSTNYAMSSKFAWVEPAAPQIDPEWGIPPEMYFHYLTQYSKSMDDAIQFVTSTPRAGVTGNFIFAEPISGTVKAIEANAQHYVVRSPGDLNEKDFLIQVNNFNHPDMKPYDGWYGYLSDPLTDDNVYRYATMMELASASSASSGVDLGFVKSLWRDSNWYDPYLKEWHNNDPLSGRVPGNGGFETFAIFYPVDKTAYIQYGNARGPGAVPYGTGEYTKLMLLESPEKVSDQAQQDGHTYCSSALEQFFKLENTGKLADPVLKQQIEDRLNEGYLAISDGTAAAAEAYYAEKKNEQLALYGTALTNYSKGQLYCQKAGTQMNSLTAP
jgi:hypothetical protein